MENEISTIYELWKALPRNLCYLVGLYMVDRPYSTQFPCVCDGFMEEKFNGPMCDFCEEGKQWTNVVKFMTYCNGCGDKSGNYWPDSVRYLCKGCVLLFNDKTSNDSIIAVRDENCIYTKPAEIRWKAYPYE